MIGKFKKIATYFWDAVKVDLGLESRKSPQILSYLITNICNSHCITCSAWKCTEPKYIDGEHLRYRLGSSLFSDIRHVGISGGEPSTFNNLTEQIDIILSTLPKIRTLSITSNCILSDYWEKHLEEIYLKCIGKGVMFQLNVSLDGIDKMHDRIRGTKGNFSQTDKVVKFAKGKGIPFQLHTTINKYNVYHAGAILHYAKSAKADIVFRLASEIYRLDNDGQIARITLNSKELSFFCDFLCSKALLEYTGSPARRIFYKKLAEQLLCKTSRLAPCYFKQQGIVLSSDGSLSFCSRFSENFGNLADDDTKLISRFRDKKAFEECCNGRCSDCYHDQSGVWPLHILANIYLKEKFLSLGKILSIGSFGVKSICMKPKKSVDAPITDVAICGMYGGEHVGDAAILGGVVYRLRRRYPSIRKISVYSFRPDRTRCWVNNLSDIERELEIDVVGDYADFTRKLADCQLLVWGGGPLMELPVVLSRNYMFIRKALALRCRFEIEGVGYGPINSSWGRIITDKILHLGTRITVRSDKDAESLLAKGLDMDERQPFVDPAFDYLKELPQNLNLENQEKKEIERLLSKKDGQKILALNLRPLWGRYGKCKTFDFNAFLDEISKMIVYMSSQNVVTVFFPMNADQYGFSDLEVAYALKDRIGQNEMFRIWETEPTIRSVVYLLRNVDVAFCMRFHAVIFSLSQNIRTIGIDYSLNGNGKVATLFAGKEDHCLSILGCEADKMRCKIEYLLNEKK